MRARLLVCVLILLTAACGGPPRPVDVDLEPLLIQSGDLPAGLAAEQVRDSWQVDLEGLPAATQTAYRAFAREGIPAGDVIVWRYTSPADAAQAYGVIAASMQGRAVPAGAIGERAEMKVGAAPGFAVSSIVFARCNTVTSIVMYISDLEAVQTYATRLDTRLQAAVCP